MSAIAPRIGTTRTPNHPPPIQSITLAKPVRKMIGFCTSTEFHQVSNGNGVGSSRMRVPSPQAARTRIPPTTNSTVRVSPATLRTFVCSIALFCP